MWTEASWEVKGSCCVDISRGRRYLRWAVCRLKANNTTTCLIIIRPITHTNRDNHITNNNHRPSSNISSMLIILSRARHNHTTRSELLGHTCHIPVSTVFFFSYYILHMYIIYSIFLPIIGPRWRLAIEFVGILEASKRRGFSLG